MKHIFLFMVVFALYMIFSIPINNCVEGRWLYRSGDFGIGLPMFKYWIHVDGDLQHGGDGGVLFLNLVIVLLITIILSLIRKRINDNK